MAVVRTQEILYLALRKGEITSEDVIAYLVGEVKNRRDHRTLLAQASTLLRRLYNRGALERRWVRERRGQYVYTPSEKIIGTLLPALDVLEERKRRKKMEEALIALAREIILKLRMEDDVKAILWNPSEYEDSKEGPRTKVWFVMGDMKEANTVERKTEARYGVVKIDPIFVTTAQLTNLQNLESMKILYGWSFITSSKRTSK